jgi:DNA replication protein DnaC
MKTQVKNSTEITIEPSEEKNPEYLKCLAQCKKMNEKEGTVYANDKYRCEECKNEGYIYFPKYQNGNYIITSKPCKCKKIRDVLLHLRLSGLENVIENYTFKNFITKEEWQKNIKAKAEKFCLGDDNWFFIGGQSGCGKTHLCTAICGQLLKRNKRVFYMLWVNDIKDLKNTINDYEEHNKLLEKYRKADVLYIDDFFKNGKERDGKVQPPSASDVQLAYDILNFRYFNPNLITIISSERTLNDIIDIDEATGGRIYERANNGEYILNIKSDKKRNFRTKNIAEI